VVASARIDVLEMRRQTVEVTGQEILPSDKVTLRVNISAVYEVVDVTKYRPMCAGRWRRTVFALA
jgi:hypothetical protein